MHRIICTQQFKKLPLFVPAVHFVQNSPLPVESVSSHLIPKVFCGDKMPFRHVRGTDVLSVLKMEAVDSFEMLVPSPQTKRYDIPEESKLHFHHPENFKSHSTEIILNFLHFFEDILLISLTFLSSLNPPSG